MKKREFLFFALALGIAIGLITFKYYYKAPVSLKHASLFDAVWAGDLQETDYYIARGASLEKNEDHRVPPLNAAVFHGHLQIAELLLKHGADVHAMNDEGGWTALHGAAAQNRIDFAQLLIKYGADVNETARANTERFNDFGDTPLLAATSNGHLDMVTFLIEHGADVNKTDNNGITPLHAAVNNNHTEVVKYLLSKNAEVNTWDCRAQEMPLNTAQDNKNTEIIALLTKAGAVAEERISWLDIPLEEATS